MKVNAVFRLTMILVSCLSFSSFIIWGKQGIISYFNTKQEIEAQLAVVDTLLEEKKLLLVHVDEWQKDSFLYEKVAREELLMGKPGEMVYLTK